MSGVFFLRHTAVLCMYACVQPEDGPDKIHADNRQTVKNTIVTLMLKSPEQIQKQVIASDPTHFIIYLAPLVT